MALTIAVSASESGADVGARAGDRTPVNAGLEGRDLLGVCEDEIGLSRFWRTEDDDMFRRCNEDMGPDPTMALNGSC
jgi:hypothetical protein